MRDRAVLWRVALLLAWVGAIVGLVYLDSNEASWYIALGPPLTVAVGAVVNRWWVLWAPVPVTVAFVTITLATEGDCTGACSEPTEWQAAVFVTMLIFTLPAVAALGIGVGLRRSGRRLPPGEQHA
jgi:hypothetical protein